MNPWYMNTVKATAGFWNRPPLMIDGAPYPRYNELFANVLAGMLTNLSDEDTDFSKFRYVNVIEEYNNGSLKPEFDYRLTPAAKYAGLLINGEVTCDEALTLYYKAVGWRRIPADEKGNPILF